NGTKRESRRSTLWNAARWDWRRGGTPRCRPEPAPGEWHKTRVAEINPMERRTVGLAAGQGAWVADSACSRASGAIRALLPGEWHKSRMVDINPVERRAVGVGGV